MSASADSAPPLAPSPCAGRGNSNVVVLRAHSARSTTPSWNPRSQQGSGSKGVRGIKRKRSSVIMPKEPTMTEKLRVAVRKFGPFESAIQKQYASFQAASGCPLELEIASLDLGPLYETMFTGGGLASGAWDIGFVVTDWVAEAVQAGALLDLAPLHRAAPFPDYPHGWSPAMTRFQQFGESFYGIPYHDGPECFIYRADLFGDPAEQAAFAARCGYPLAPPRTWAQFEEIARFFNRPEQGLYGTVFAAFPDGHNTVYDFCLQLWSRGGDLTDASGAITLDTPEAAAGIDFYRRLVNDRGMTPPGLQEIDSVKSGELFASGQIAMMVNWFGFA